MGAEPKLPLCFPALFVHPGVMELTPPKARLS
jgi:hypothetical protein